MPVDSPMVTHISESLRYISPSEPHAVKEAPHTPRSNNPPSARETLLPTLATSTPGLIVSPEYAHIDSHSTIAEPPTHLREVVDLSDIEHNDYRRKIMTIRECHLQMFSGHVW